MFHKKHTDINVNPDIYLIANKTLLIKHINKKQQQPKSKPINMRTTNCFVLFFYGLLIIFSGCGTIVGGSKYYAHVKVKDHPMCSIEYMGQFQGNGSALIKVNRRDADNFAFVVNEKGCKEQVFSYHNSVLRGGALFGTLIGWTGLYNGIPLPWGIVVDMATGSLWKPDIKEPGISKIDYDNFMYVINYTGCENTEKE